ncbi:MAG: PAS domain-containing protein, partial [Oscillospiraceae bacterium]
MMIKKTVKSKDAKSESTAAAILKKRDIQYWIFYLEENSAVPGSNIMADLSGLESWDNFPQCLIDMGLIHRCSVKEWLQIHSRIRLGEKEISTEIRVIENGTPVWKRIQYTTDFDEQGNPISATGIAENISAYKSLAENYAEASKQCGVTIWSFDLANKTIYDFNNASHIKAFDGVRTINNVPEVFAAPDSSMCIHDVPAMYEMYDRIYAGEKTASSISRWKNKGSDILWWYEISYTTIFDDDGKPIRAIGTGLDISERVRLEARYEEEIKWRNVHSQDVIGSFKMNLTQNTCGDGQ